MAGSVKDDPPRGRSLASGPESVARLPIERAGFYMTSPVGNRTIRHLGFVPRNSEAQGRVFESLRAHHFKDRSSFEIERSFLSFTVVS